MQDITRLTDWAKDSLTAHGYTIHSPLEEIQKTPYSSVIRFSTSKGYVYLKQMPLALSTEARMMQLLLQQFQANVPKVIDQNKSLNCFLMNDCGKPLKHILKNNFQIDLSLKAIELYTQIQNKTKDHLNTFLELGVPDWRLEKLPILYNEIIEQEALLKSDGLTQEEFKILHALRSDFASMCDLLQSYPTAATLDHCDFHHGNILMDPNTETMTVIDWAETVITHPFFSLFSYLTHTSQDHGFKETDLLFSILKKACFKNDEEALLVKKIFSIYLALGYHRLILSGSMNTDSTKLKSYFNTGRNTGRFAYYFKEFIRVSVHLEPGDISRVRLTDTYRIPIITPK